MPWCAVSRLRVRRLLRPRYRLQAFPGRTRPYTLKGVVIKAPSNALDSHKTISYRFSTRAADVVRVAVAVELTNPGTLPWTVKGAVLVGKNQEVKPLRLIWQPLPIPPNPEELGVIVVELEMTAREARGPFTLKLWDESEKRVVTLGNVTFP